MKTKVLFVVQDSEKEDYSNEGFNLLREKLNGKIISLPYTPAKGMLLKIEDFHKDYNFDDKTLRYLDKDGWYIVEEIFMNRDYLLVALGLEEE